ncbi:hypothetical protein THAOC_06654, partial [Thalassiosira oceanica]
RVAPRPDQGPHPARRRPPPLGRGHTDPDPGEAVPGEAGRDPSHVLRAHDPGLRPPVAGRARPRDRRLVRHPDTVGLPGLVRQGLPRGQPLLRHADPAHRPRVPGHDARLRGPVLDHNRPERGQDAPCDQRGRGQAVEHNRHPELVAGRLGPAAAGGAGVQRRGPPVELEEVHRPADVPVRRHRHHHSPERGEAVDGPARARGGQAAVHDPRRGRKEPREGEARPARSAHEARVRHEDPGGVEIAHRFDAVQGDAGGLAQVQLGHDDPVPLEVLLRPGSHAREDCQCDNSSGACIWRRRTATKLYGPLLHRMKLAKQRKRNKAATAIQSAWRGYIDFSSYLIMRYEARASTVIQAYWRRYRQATTYSILIAQTITLQSLVRGYQERAWQSFRTDCAIAIQASARRFLTRKECHNECMVTILISAAAAALRARSAVRRLQSWWGGEMLKKRQKQAALVIERFFIFVKKEVEKEVKALKRKKKEKRRRRKLKQSDDYILEKAWMGLDGDTTALPTPEEQAVQHFHPPTVANLDSRKLYGKSDKFGSVDVDVQSDVSGLTDLSQQGGTYRTSKYSRRVPKKSQYDMDDDASLEQAYLDTEIQQSKNEKKYKSNKLPPSRRPNRSYARSDIGDESDDPELDDASLSGMAAEYEVQHNVVDQERREEKKEEAAQYFPADNQAQPRIVHVPDSIAELGFDEDEDFDVDVEDDRFAFKDKERSDGYIEDGVQEIGFESTSTNR